MMNTQTIKEFIRRFQEKHHLTSPVSSADIDYIDLTQTGIDAFAQKCSQKLQQELSKLPAKTPGAFLFFENILMTARLKSGQVEYLTKQHGMRDITQLCISVNDLLDADQPEENYSSIHTFTSWTIHPSGTTQLSEKIFKRFLAKSIHFYCERIPDDDTECLLYLPPFSSQIPLPDWEQLLHKINSDIPVTLHLKDFGELIDCPPGKTRYLILHAPGVQSSENGPCIISAYRMDQSGIRRNLGCSAFDADSYNFIADMCTVPDLIIHTKKIQVSFSKEVHAVPTLTNLPVTVSHFHQDNLMYSFLEMTTDSFIRKTYRLGTFAGQADAFLQDMRSKFHGNRELEIADLCTAMTGNPNLEKISLGDAVYLARRISCESKQNIFIESGLSTHNSSDARFGGCSVIPRPSESILDLPANFAEATWRAKQHTSPYEYWRITRKNIATLSLDQVLTSIVAYYSNCTTADVAEELLYWYSPSQKIKPSALFTANVFLYLAHLSTIQLKSPGNPAYGGIVIRENTAMKEIKPILPVRAKANHSASAKAPSTQKSNFVWFKQEIAKPKAPVKIESLGLSVRAYNCLHRAGIQTTKDLASKTYSDLMKIRNLGRRAADETKQKLQQAGFSLKDG